MTASDSDSGGEEAGPPFPTEAFSRAFRQHERILVRWLAQKFGDIDIARDIAQSAYLRVWRYAQTQKIDNLRALVFQTAANLAANEFRARKRRPTVSIDPSIAEQLDVSDLARCQAQSPEASAIWKQEIAQLMTAISELPTPARRAFVLSRFEEKTYREIAEILGVSESSVEKYIIAALKALRRASAETVNRQNVIPLNSGKYRR